MAEESIDFSQLGSLSTTHLGILAIGGDIISR
jgi:hypothetical protein